VPNDLLAASWCAWMRVWIGVPLPPARPLSEEELRISLAVVYRVSFSYDARGAPISSAVVDLNDWSRSVEIEGADPAQVDALFALLSQEVSGHSTWFGGTGFRFLIMLCLWVTGTAFINLTFSKGNLVFPAPHVRPFVVVGLLILGLLFLIEPVGSRWFPGTVVWASHPSFWGRHSALISFIGALLGMVAILQAAYLARRSRQPRTD